MSLLIGTRNSTTQTVVTNGVVNLGAVARRYCKKNLCGLPAFLFNGTSISIQTPGIYEVIVTLVASGTEAGDVTFQLNENEIAVPTAISTQTITTANTEIRTFVISASILVDSNCVLNTKQTSIKNISIVNTGVGAIVTNVSVNIIKGA